MSVRAGRSSLLLVLLALFALAAAASVPAPLAPQPDGPAELRAELERERALRRAAEQRVAELERELEQRLAERLEREREWLRYTRAIAAISPAGLAGPSFVPAVAEPAAAAPVAEDATAGATAEAAAGPATATAGTSAAATDEQRLAAVARRDEEVARALRSLMVIDGLHGLDLLEAGTLMEGGTGPIVLRVLDDAGRPLGSLSAARLRFVGSLSGRTLTWILEDGYELRMGERTPFAPPADAADAARRGVTSERRIAFAHVDPARWIEALPELFDARSSALAPDDGRFDLVALRQSINELLREDAVHGYYRLRALGGVQGDVLREVHLEDLDAEGRLECRLFADRMRVVRQQRGVMLLLEDGAQLRGERKSAFLDGRYRAFLPRADAERWRAAGVPGVEPEPQATEPEPQAPEGG